MKKYSSFTPKSSSKPQRQPVHPIWRGVGFVMAILIPVISFFSSLVLLDEKTRPVWLVIPGDLIAKGSDPLIYIKIIITVAIMFILYIVLLFITFLVNKLFAPPRYGPLDVPPTAYKGPRYKR